VGKAQENVVAMLAAHEEEDRVKRLCVPAEKRGFQQVFYFVGVPLVQFLNPLLGVKAFLRRDAQVLSVPGKRRKSIRRLQALLMGLEAPVLRSK
jgi:hypothetical protein